MPLRHDETDHASLPPTISQTACCEATRETVHKPAAAPAPGSCCAEDLVLPALCGKAWHGDQISVNAPPASLSWIYPGFGPWLAGAAGTAASGRLTDTGLLNPDMPRPRLALEGPPGARRATLAAHADQGSLHGTPAGAA